MFERTEEIDRIEDRLLAGVVRGHGEHLSRTRRMVAQLRRHVVPQPQTLAMRGRLPDWLAPGDAGSLRQAVERVAAVGHDLGFVQERAFLLPRPRSSPWWPSARPTCMACRSAQPMRVADPVRGLMTSTRRGGRAP
jgi:hypothetical protein